MAAAIGACLLLLAALLTRLPSCKPGPSGLRWGSSGRLGVASGPIAWASSAYTPGVAQLAVYS